MSLEFLLLGPRSIDGSGRTQLVQTYFQTIRPNPNKRANVTHVVMNAIKADRSALTVGLQQVICQAIVKDTATVKATLLDMKLYTISPTEV